jgi:ADP-heptose:LPS heptosyltransferase
VRRVLVARTDNAGDVLLAGPAVRAVARSAEVTLLVSPTGAPAAELLPGVAEVLVHPAPWSGDHAPAADPGGAAALVADVRARGFDAGIVLTSFHQSPLPVALLLRLAGVPHLTAASTDHPGSLLDVRLAPPSPGDPRHEVERALDTVAAAGFPGLPGDDRLALRHPLPWPDRTRVPELDELAHGGYVAVHPGASVPARAIAPDHATAIVRALRARGRRVVVTGDAAEAGTTARVAAASGAVDLGGRLSFAELAAVLERAACLVGGNSAPGHLAAAVGTRVVSLFSPVVPAAWWRPWGVPVTVLGDQHAPCRDTRARTCPVPGHPCLSGVSPGEVAAACEDDDARRGGAA